MIHMVSVKFQLRCCDDVISYQIIVVVNVSLNKCPKLTVLQNFQWVVYKARQSQAMN